jgi:hypothetical protein
MSGEQMASTATRIRANSWLHLAGIPPHFLVPNEAPLTIGFTGCMQALQVNFTSSAFQFLESKNTAVRDNKKCCVQPMSLKKGIPPSSYLIPQQFISQCTLILVPETVSTRRCSLH